MLGAKSFLCIDFGAGTLKVAEFDVNEAGALRLLRYATKGLGLAGAQESSREGVVLRGLQEQIGSKQFAAKTCSVCAPGFQTFSKFVKLPPVDSSKVAQIIQYEAQQNVPFPLEEVVWDYQILGTTPSGEMEVLLVAVKSEVIEKLSRATDGAGLRLDLVDAAPAALCNAFRYNYSDVTGCSLLLDIGAKTSNVLLFEKGRVFCRSINIGANSISQDFAAEVKLPFVEAERFKIAEGFVSLGGAYEEPDNPKVAAISKIARQVMTRLHIQVNQTIQFYRSQQGGSAPERVYLAGGASLMPYTAQFFSEKLNLEVEYFNPFRNIQIDPSVNVEELAKMAHAFGEVVGVGLRTPAQCPVELNLMPKSILKRQALNQKKPYFLASVFSLVLVIFAIGWFYGQLAAEKQRTINERQPQLERQQQKASRFHSALNARNRTQNTVDQYGQWMRQRFAWADVLNALDQSLRTTMAANSVPGRPCDLWIEKFAPENMEPPGGALSSMQNSMMPNPSGPNHAHMDIRMMIRYGLIKGVHVNRNGQVVGNNGQVMSTNSLAALANGGDEESSSSTNAPPRNTNQVALVKLTCRAVDWSSQDPGARFRLANSFLTNLKQHTCFNFGTNGTTFAKSEFDTNSEGTFAFGVHLKLTRPIKLN